MTRYIGAIDQGTTSSRFIVFDRAGDDDRQRAARAPADLSAARLGRARSAGDLRDNTVAVIAEALREADLTPRDLAAIGITNQRETTLLWDRATGAAGAQRAGLAGHARRCAGRGICARRRAGSVPRADRLPLASYFSATEAALAARQRAGRAPPRRGRRPGVRHHRYLAAVAPDRRAPHRRHQRQPHATDGPGDAATGTTRCLPRSAFRARCCRGSCRPPRCMPRRARRWTACRSPASSATSRRRCSARRASNRARRRTPTAPAASC